MSQTIATIAQQNGFSLNEQGVFQAKDEIRPFNYSDGEESERALMSILENAKDLSSSSDELQKHIVDWPTEYHLSSTRANLLRAINLDGVFRVLELGCGCGSITRYLGEQPNVTVDAVEGSPVRASLAKLRCRDLDNVQISTANFNDIEVPEGEYDLVLFVGVTEYAGRFSNAKTDQEAVNELLKMGQRACKTDGVVLVAIENRLGMKYALGANEDHYATPFIGLDDYPSSTGIRTYSHQEWLAQIEKANFTHSELLLPFPDYKIPTVVFSQQCDAEVAIKALKNIQSRDYSSAFNLGSNEWRLWQTVINAQTVAEHSNSFLWLLGNDKQRMEKMATPVLSQFDQPEHQYSLVSEEQEVGEMRQIDAKLIEHLKAQITQLESHSSNLEGKVGLMSNSVGWRFLNGIRRMLRRTTL